MSLGGIIEVAPNAVGADAEASGAELLLLINAAAVVEEDGGGKGGGKVEGEGYWLGPVTGADGFTSVVEVEEEEEVGS